MAERRIKVIGLSSLPGNDFEHHPFSDHAALLDADIVVTRCLDTSEYFLDEDDPDDNETEKLKSDWLYWQAEIKRALAAGRTVVAFLDSPQQVDIDVSKTVHSYDIFPATLDKWHATNGRLIAYRTKEFALKPLYETLREWFEYKVCFSPQDFPGTGVLFQSKGSDIVGGFNKTSPGTLVLLPFVDFGSGEFWTGDDMDVVSKKGEQLGKRLMKVLVDLHNNFFAESRQTPPPLWVETIASKKIPAFTLASQKLLELTSRAKEIEIEKVSAEAKRDSALALTALLYETGKPLEKAIREVLALLGFKAEPFDDGDSEFDAVFVSDGVSYLGEAEGKDSDAVDVKKISQLIRNKGEFFRINEVVPRCILFGNAYRLSEPATRPTAFTKKCVTVAVGEGIVLIDTTHLFELSLHFQSKKDEEFKVVCRKALHASNGGLFKFPAP